MKEIIEELDLEIQTLESEAFVGSEFEYCEKAGYIKGLKDAVKKIKEYETKESPSNKV